MASLGAQPDLLARAIKILEESVALMELGYTTSARALDGKGRSIHPADPAARKWRLDGALVAATTRVYDNAGIDHDPDTIDVTVAFSHPWCGANMTEKVTLKSQASACERTLEVADMLRRNQERIKANKAKSSS